MSNNRAPLLVQACSVVQATLLVQARRIGRLPAPARTAMFPSRAMRAAAFALFVLTCALTASIAAAQPVKQSVPGIVNFTKLDTTIACAGATTPEAVAEVKRLGYASIVNLRMPTEAGANMEAEEAAAKAAGIRYFSMPFDGAAPDPAVADRFIATVTALENQPAFVHCASANRAAGLWMIKRMVVDGWDAERAGTEAVALGLTNAALRTFAIDYATTHKK